MRSPARCGYLDHPGIVKGVLLRIKVGVFPHSDQFPCTDGIGPGSRLDVDRADNGRQLIHLGLGLRYAEAEDDSFHFREPPEANTAPNFLDTG